ncbi:hypothetical protein LCGC14_3034840, partial [marine sediment metagenome]
MIEIKSRIGKLIVEYDVKNIEEAVELAVSKNINLSGANLSGTNLSGADLSGANLH